MTFRTTICLAIAAITVVTTGCSDSVSQTARQVQTTAEDSPAETRHLEPEPQIVEPALNEPADPILPPAPAEPAAAKTDVVTASDANVDKLQPGDIVAQGPDAKAEEAAGPEKTKPARALPRPRGPKNTYYLTFEDLEINMKESQKFEESMLTPNVRKLDGKRIRIAGVIHAGSLFKQSGVKQFVMLKNIECPFGPGATAHHNMRVTLSEGIEYTTRAITIEGTLKVDPYTGPDGTTWALYTLTGKKVK